MTQCLRIIVTGRVQGVCYRANALKQAEKLNLTGFVRNLNDGSVEAVACGDTADLQAFTNWCRQGPLLAKVANIAIQTHDSTETFQSFEIR